MKTITNKQKGFSLVLGLLIIVLVGVVGFAGYYVWQLNDKKKYEITDYSEININYSYINFFGGHGDYIQNNKLTSGNNNRYLSDEELEKTIDLMNKSKFFKLENENFQTPEQLCSDSGYTSIEISVDDRNNTIGFEDCGIDIDSSVQELSYYLRNLAAN